MNHLYSTKVTTGIPFYGATNPEQLRQAVDSILSQSLPPQELHLIQDGPVSRELEELVDDYVNRFNTIKHILVGERAGLPRALNLSILSCLTCYYARMDADDIAHSDRLKKQVEFLELHPEIDILGTWALEFEHDPLQDGGLVRKVPTHPTEIETFFHYRNPIVHPTVMFRRSVFAKIGIYEDKYGVYCDLGLWANALKLKVGIANLPEVLLYYRTSGLVKRRMAGLVEQVRARYHHNTLSPKLNLLKVLSLGFRLLPYQIQEWGYKNLRD